MICPPYRGCAAHRGTSGRGPHVPAERADRRHVRPVRARPDRNGDPGLHPHARLRRLRAGRTPLRPVRRRPVRGGQRHVRLAVPRAPRRRLRRRARLRLDRLRAGRRHVPELAVRRATAAHLHRTGRERGDPVRLSGGAVRGPHPHAPPGLGRGHPGVLHRLRRQRPGGRRAAVPDRLRPALHGRRHPHRPAYRHLLVPRRFPRGEPHARAPGLADAARPDRAARRGDRAPRWLRRARGRPRRQTARPARTRLPGRLRGRRLDGRGSTRGRGDRVPARLGTRLLRPAAHPGPLHEHPQHPGRPGRPARRHGLGRPRPHRRHPGGPGRHRGAVPGAVRPRHGVHRPQPGAARSLGRRGGPGSRPGRRRVHRRQPADGVVRGAHRGLLPGVPQPARLRQSTGAGGTRHRRTGHRGGVRHSAARRRTAEHRRLRLGRVRRRVRPRGAAVALLAPDDLGRCHGGHRRRRRHGPAVGPGQPAARPAGVGRLRDGPRRPRGHRRGPGVRPVRRPAAEARLLADARRRNQPSGTHPLPHPSPGGPGHAGHRPAVRVGQRAARPAHPAGAAPGAEAERAAADLRVPGLRGADAPGAGDGRARHGLGVPQRRGGPRGGPRGLRVVLRGDRPP
ncbi:hypothetical protein LRR80_06759 [Streptomyces sp. RO-S4]|nr:hypothetical protein [Streptomyces sp. RO-S4]